MPGTIIFKPIEANIVSKDKDIIGKMDPYLSFHVGGVKRVKGEVAKSGGQHPIWNDAITIEVTDQNSLTVDLKDKDMLIDDKIGSFEVDLREVQSQGQVRKWYPIFRRNEPAGELLMESTFSGSNIGQYGLSQGQYGSTLGQGQYGSTLGQGQQTSTLGQGQYSSTLGQGQHTSALGQGQYGSTLGQGQHTSTLGQGQYSSNLSQGGIIGGSTTYGQSNRVITTPGTVISHTSTSYPLQSGTQGQTQYGGLPQGQLGGLPQGQLGGLPQGQLGGLPQGQFGQAPTQGLGSQPASSEQFAKEAIMRGTDPLNTQQNYYSNVGQAGLGGLQGQNLPGQGFMGQGQNLQSQGQNLTQTPNFSGTDPLLYEGDKNRYSNPPQQIPYGRNDVQEYGHRHHPESESMNPNQNANADPNRRQ